MSGDGIGPGSVVSKMTQEFVPGKGLVHSVSLNRATIGAIGEVSIVLLINLLPTRNVRFAH